MTPACAHAGAWIAPEGGQSIVNGVVSSRDDITAYETSTYVETPVGERTALILSGWGEFAEDLPDLTRIETTMAVKYTLWRGDRSVMALQAGALWVTDPLDGCSEGGAEVRWLGGVNVTQRTFANLEVAGRALDGPSRCQGARADLTLGYHPSGNWLALGQIFADAPVDGEETLKAQFSLVRFGASGRRGLQLGLRFRVDGGAAEPALVLGVWGRPGD